MRTSLTKICLSIAGNFVAGSLVAGPVPMDKNVTPMAPVPECNWTGFYVGVNVGITELHSSFTDVNNWENRADNSYYTPAFIGGGQVGYNYQWQDLVFGIEADFLGLAGDHNGVFRHKREETGDS